MTISRLVLALLLISAYARAQFINEIHYNNAGGDRDENVEVALPPSTSINGWTLALYNGGTSKVYDTLALSGAAGSGWGFEAFPVPGIQNGPRDGLALVRDDGEVVQLLSYEGRFTAADGPAKGVRSTNIGVREKASTPPGKSLQLSGNGVDASDFTWVGPIRSTMGTSNPGQLFFKLSFDVPSTLTPIFDIQGASQISPAVTANEVVRFSGVITGTDRNGFYIQDPVGDGINATSDGIFLRNGVASESPDPRKLRIGDEVLVAGNIEEFKGRFGCATHFAPTEVFGPSEVVVLSDDNELPAPVVIGAKGRSPPTEHIDSDPGTFEPETDGLNFYESLEHMRVMVKNPVVIQPNTGRGGIWVLSDNGALASGLNARGTLLVSPDDFNPERIQIVADDGALSGFKLPRVKVGDRLSDVVGFMNYRASKYEVRVSEPFTRIRREKKPIGASMKATKRRILVASLKLGLRGAPDYAKAISDTAKLIVKRLNTPDVLAFQEFRPNDRNESAAAALQALVDAVEALGGPLYRFIDHPFPTNTDGARNTFLYRPSRVVHRERRLESIVPPGSDNAFTRLPLAATFLFKQTRRLVEVVNVQLSSRFVPEGARVACAGSPIFGTSQPYEALQDDPGTNIQVDERVTQVQSLLPYLSDGKRPKRLLIVGDFSDVDFSPPVKAMTANFESLTEKIPEQSRYSTIFDGNAYLVARGFAGAKLASKATKAELVHWNSEFPRASNKDDPLLVSLLAAKT